MKNSIKMIDYLRWKTVKGICFQCGRLHNGRAIVFKNKFVCPECAGKKGFISGRSNASIATASKNKD